jgi:hypothetical protein
MIPTKNKFRRVLLFGLMFAFAGGAFLSGCSSSDEASNGGNGGGGGSCQDQCADVEPINHEQCIFSCQAG